MTQEILRFQNVSYNYHTPQGETAAVKGLSLTVHAGEFAAIIGPSGCGKSTVLSLGAGLLSPTSGKVLFSGRFYGYMLQRDELFAWRTIEKNLLLPAEIRKSPPEARDYALGLAHKYGLGEFLKKYPDQLSGGMRQRAALIRTLSTRPDLLLLDEPFSALDYQTRLSVCNDVSRILRTEKATALLVTHDVSEAIALADTVFVLSARPARVVSCHPLGFSPSLTPMQRRQSPIFSEWFDRLRRELKL